MTTTSTLKDAARIVPPSNREAYSDRTAFLMAHLARLAYLDFYDLNVLLKTKANDIVGLGNADDVSSNLRRFLSEYEKSKRDGLIPLNAELDSGAFEFVQGFDSGSTQAMLVKREFDRMVVLAFRGTESEQFSDFKTDLDAYLHDDTGTRIHRGFLRAFEAIEDDVESALAPFQRAGYKIYFTGHSLGGALAVVATHKLGNDLTAACYTFGGPRVGNEDFSSGIKIPIYRVVNAADVVPHLPPVYTTELLTALFGLVPYKPLRDLLLDFAEKFRAYTHVGDMRFLTPARELDHADTKILPNPEPLTKARIVLFRWIRGLSSAWKDHSTHLYCDKLGVVVQRRAIESKPLEKRKVRF